MHFHYEAMSRPNHIISHQCFWEKTRGKKTRNDQRGQTQMARPLHGLRTNGTEKAGVSSKPDGPLFLHVFPFGSQFSQFSPTFFGTSLSFVFDECLVRKQNIIETFTFSTFLYPLADIALQRFFGTRQQMLQHACAHCDCAEHIV